MNQTYCINPITGLTKEVSLQIMPPLELISGIHCSKYNYPEIAQRKLSRVLKIMEERHSDQHISEKINEITAKFFDSTLYLKPKNLFNLLSHFVHSNIA